MRTRAPIYCEVLGVDHFLDGSYNQGYFGNLTDSELKEIVDLRLINGEAVEQFFRSCNYSLFVLSKSGEAKPIDHIDLEITRPGYQGERNILALPKNKLMQ